MAILMVHQTPRRNFPCNECPVRRDNADNPQSKFPEHRWDELRATIGEADVPGLLDMPMFGCHKGTPGEPEEDLACAGWLAAFGHRSVPVRLAVSFGQLDPAALTPGPGWPELYEDWDEMAEAQQWNPGDPGDHLPAECRLRVEAAD
ncbi:MAG: hypothetical protein HOY79_17640 [Streptomyces sp.]|nr:hypothetical protein [Streptomyces sp.]